MSVRARLKQLGKDSIVYGFGGILARSIAFFLLPVYTRLFDPAEYGVITMLTLLGSLVAPLLIMGMDSAQTFFFFEQKGNQQAQTRLVTAVLQWRLTWGIVIIGIALLVSPLLNTAFFDGQLSWVYFVLTFVGVLFTQLTGQASEVFRLQYRAWAYLGLDLGQTIISAAITLILILWLGWGILGFFAGSTIGSFIILWVGWWTIRPYLDWSTWHRDWWPKLLQFGAPFVPVGLAMYVLQASDRWFISYYFGLEALGLYGVGLKFVALLALVTNTYRKAWGPVAMDAVHSEDGPQLFRTISRLYLGFGSAAVVVLAALSPWLVQLLTAPAYHSAYPIVGVLAWQPMFYGFYPIISVGIRKTKRTIWILVGAGLAALLNILLDAWLVPQFGNLGAAAATSFSFFAWNALSLWVTEKLWPVHYPLGIFGLQIGVGVAAMTGILYLYGHGQELWQVMVVTLVALICLAVLTIERKHIAAFYKYKTV